ncbi:Immunoglobulin lambda variable 3-9 [Labeo rohita]|nr:Immunoglobulin lambda variable 3-9 [Labeo rohita]
MQQFNPPALSQLHFLPPVPACFCLSAEHAQFHLKRSVSQDCIMLKILQLQLYLLAYCQVEEILTYQLTDLGQNVTINCGLDLKEVTWLLLNSPDPPVLILHSISNPPATFYFNKGFKEKYSVQSKHNLFIKDVSIDELGVYYCTNIDRTAQFSNGTRLDQTTPITVPTPVSECLCQNHTVVEESTDPTLWKTASVVFSLINVCLVFGFIGELDLLLLNEVGQYEGVNECGCPRQWCWSDCTIGGTEGSLPCSEVEEESAPFARRPEPAFVCHVGEEQARRMWRQDRPVKSTQSPLSSAAGVWCSRTPGLPFKWYILCQFSSSPKFSNTSGLLKDNQKQG